VFVVDFQKSKLVAHDRSAESNVFVLTSGLKEKLADGTATGRTANLVWNLF